MYSPFLGTFTTDNFDFFINFFSIFSTTGIKLDKHGSFFLSKQYSNFRDGFKLRARRSTTSHVP